jgi:membrane protease YdiL (CAAX protease family)
MESRRQGGSSVGVNHRKQLTILGVALVVYGLIILLTYLLTPLAMLVPPGQAIPPALSATPRWQLALGGAGGTLVLYGALGLAGYWLSRKLELPGIYRKGAGWRAWVLWPLLLGLGLGAILIIGDQLFSRIASTPGFPHPEFPLSVLASGAAGIGEEILFRGFVMCLWGFLLNLLLRRWQGRSAALWIGNVIAALAFSAAHLPSAMILFHATSLAQIPASILGEIFLLNSALGLVAGERSWRDGLVAAMGVHFWADVLWHVVWPLVGLGTG